jgi:hypothetical protein
MTRLKGKQKKEREENIQLAIKHYRKCKTDSSIRLSAETYGIPYRTLRDRLAGAQNHRESHRHQQLLTEQEEKSIVRWILKMDDWGFPPRLAVVKEIAAHLVSCRASGRKLGVHWMQMFLERNPEVATKLAVRLERQRAYADNPAIIKDYFKKV